MSKPNFLTVFLGAGDLHGQHIRRAFDDDLVHGQLDFASGQTGVDGIIRTLKHLSSDRQHAFNADILDRCEQRTGNVNHALGKAGFIAQVEKHQVAVVAFGMNPTG